MIKTIFFVTLLSTTFTTEAEELAGTVVSIADGDTLTLLVNSKKHKIQLAEIDTPEMEQPWGFRASQALSQKVFLEQVKVTVLDVDRYGRTVGRIWLDDRDITRELVAEGHAWVYRQYMTDRSLLADEETARSNELGLWSQDDPVPPWKWRHGARAD